jgi:hypothetical protein
VFFAEVKEKKRGIAERYAGHGLIVESSQRQVNVDQFQIGYPGM